VLALPRGTVLRFGATARAVETPAG
jgi:hypothetical protein